MHGKSGADIYQCKNSFYYPLQKNRDGEYKIKSGEFIRVCMTSDFFLAEADVWRDEVWHTIKKRPDVIFILVTKRADRIEECLPHDWKYGWENVWLHVTAENQKRADERIPILLDLPIKHRGIMVEPFIGKISIGKYLLSGRIENVWAGGENYSGKRPIYYEWVKLLSDECKAADVEFAFFETGNAFVKNGRKTVFTNKQDQMKAAYLLNLNYESTREQVFNVPKFNKRSQVGLFPQQEEKIFKEICEYCLNKKRCAGCSNCGKCKE